jgi:hypothetical protein
VNDITLVLGAFGEHTRLQRRDFDGNLVGIQLDYRIAGGDGIAFLLEPPGHSGFDDRFSERGDLYGEHSD